MLRLSNKVNEYEKLTYQWPPAQGDVYSGDVSPGVCWARIVMRGGEGEVRRVRAVWRPVTPAPRIVMCF